MEKKLKQRCILCGHIAEDLYCNNCNELLKTKSIKEILQDNESLAKLLSKNGCMYCPIYQTSFCDMLYEHIICKNAEDEIKLCNKYLTNWMNYNKKEMKNEK